MMLQDFDGDEDEAFVSGEEEGGASGSWSWVMPFLTALLGSLLVAAIITLVVLLIVGGVAQAHQNSEQDKLDNAKSDHRDLMEAIIAITGLPWEDAVTGGRPDACDKSAIIRYDDKHGFD